MNNDALQKLVEDVSLQSFKRPFLHRAYFNSRLKTTGGRYHLNTHDIDINPHVVTKLGMDDLIGVIKHELCHYHLHLLNRGYRHQDKDFKQLLQQVGGSRYVKNLSTTQQLHHYQCTQCHTPIYRKRQINMQKYVCGKCKQKLRYVGKVEGTLR